MDFETAFKTLTGFLPFLWQKRLFDQYFAKGETPAALDLPTGLGKTSVMAIWLISRALCGDEVRRKLPRRLVYVVDRRAVVDQATEEAVKLREKLNGDAAQLKAKLGLEFAPLPISTLRGQYADNRDWLADPASPAIIVGTVDMIGSRLLFEGYGVSRKMRPYHAGLLGADALVVLDEAHLVPPFAHLLRSIEQGVDNADCVARHDHLGPRGDAHEAVIPRFALLPLSATQRNIGASKSRALFHLTSADEDETTRRRLDAGKRLNLLELGEGKKADEALAEKAFELATKDGNWRRVVIFCDRRDAREDESIAAAQGVSGEIEKLAKGDKKAGREKIAIDLQLMVGARRVREREETAKRLRELGFIGDKTDLVRPAILIATSAGEVGVDIDADHMVSDLVPWERMVQRLGRVNRRGEGDAEVVVFCSKPGTPKKPDSPTPAERRAIVAANAKMVLECLPTVGDGNGRDASPRALRQLAETAQMDDDLKGKIAAATTPEPLRPALSRALVDAWSMTSLEEHTGRPEVAPWLRGWVDDDNPQTTVVWRRYLPARPDWANKEYRLAGSDRKAIEDFFEAAPPHQSEKLETETFRVVEWLCARAATFSDRTISGAESATHPALDEGGDDGDALDVAKDGDGPRAKVAPSIKLDAIVALALTPAGEFSKAYSLRDLAFRRDKKDKDQLARELAGKTIVIDARFSGLSDGLLDSKLTDAVSSVDSNDGSWARAVAFRVRWIEGEDDNAGGDGWRFEFEFPLSESEDSSPARLIVEHLRGDAKNEDSRSVSKPQTLAEHQTWAANKAEWIAKRLGLPADLATALTIAARLHDEGKKAVRWQRAFNAARDQRKSNLNGPLAKTSGPINQAVLDGYRHEFGSLPFVEKDTGFSARAEEEKDLIRHLVAAHHGFARPNIETRSCDDAPPSALQERAREVALRFARLQKQWGPWGLAWLEALLRAADALASRENDERAADGGRQ